MGIQSSVNNMLGQAAIIAGLAANSPAAKERKEMKTLTKKVDVYDKAEAAENTKYQEAMQKLQQEALDTEMPKDVYEARAEAIKKQRNEVSGATAERKAAAFERMFDITGDEKYLHQSSEQAELAKIRQPKSRAQMAEEKATSHLDSSIEEKRNRKPKRHFMDYLGRESTSLGGKVGDLPMNMQKQIAKQYSSADRKRMMDKYDREDK